jgi:hypothetical protein
MTKKDIGALLREQPPVTDDKTLTKAGDEVTYIPWQDNANALDEAFGWDSWNFELREVAVKSNLSQDGWMSICRCIGKLTVIGPNGATTREGIGMGSQWGGPANSEEDAVRASTGTAASIALSRACRLLGKRFGRDLKRDKGVKQATVTPAGAAFGFVESTPKEEKIDSPADEALPPEHREAARQKLSKPEVTALFLKLRDSGGVTPAEFRELIDAHGGSSTRDGNKFVVVLDKLQAAGLTAYVAEGMLEKDREAAKEGPPL